jgi:hypothetical protein
VSVALAGKPALCNDITTGPDGAAYVTNTMAPQILRLAPGAKEFEVWFTDPPYSLPTAAPAWTASRSVPTATCMLTAIRQATSTVST